MDLKITDIRLRNFRSYEDYSLNNIGDLTIIEGANAVGKTNLIEAIGLMTSLNSFRNASINEFIKNGEEFGQIIVELNDSNRQLSESLLLNQNKKQYKLNDKVKRISELKGLAPSVTFTPDDLDLIKGSNSLRRQALDLLGSQLNKNYYQISKDFSKVLKHKNKLLKDGSNEDLIEAIDELVIKVGAQLTAYRSALFTKLLVHMRALYCEITGSDEVLIGWYVPSWKALCNETDPHRSEVPNDQVFTQDESSKKIDNAIKKNRCAEIAAKRSLIGPHKDKLEFTLNGLDASSYGSQGQQRSIVLAWKLAEVELIKEMTDQTPILLLDDVMSELDLNRRNALVGYLSNDMQTFITTANIDYFDEEMLNRAEIVKIV